jgi:hypothetical protein
MLPEEKRTPELTRAVSAYFDMRAQRRYGLLVVNGGMTAHAKAFEKHSVEEMVAAYDDATKGCYRGVFPHHAYGNGKAAPDIADQATRLTEETTKLLSEAKDGKRW